LLDDHLVDTWFCSWNTVEREIYQTSGTFRISWSEKKGELRPQIDLECMKLDS
jgi:hypothetical protein